MLFPAELFRRSCCSPVRLRGSPPGPCVWLIARGLAPDGVADGAADGIVAAVAPRTGAAGAPLPVCCTQETQECRTETGVPLGAAAVTVIFVFCGVLARVFVFPCLIIELCHFLWWIGYGRGEPPPRAARPATGVGTLPAPRAAEPPPEAVRAVRVAYRRRGAALTVPGRDRAAGEVWTETRADVPPRAAFCCVLSIQS